MPVWFTFSSFDLFIISDGDLAFGAALLFFGMIGFSLALPGAVMRIHLHVNKASGHLQIKNTIFGFTRSGYEGTVQSADQFVIRNAGGQEIGGGVSGFHNVCFASDDELVKIKVWIEGKHNAQAF